MKRRRDFSASIIAGGKSLYCTSVTGGKFVDPGVSWDWLTDNIQDRWCERFESALIAHNEEYTDESN